jgi:hypothetical protein
MGPPRNWWGFGALSLGVAALTAILVGDATTATTNYWCRTPIILALCLTGILFGVGVWALGHTYAGWWWPSTHTERVKAKAEREHREHIARVTWQDAIQEMTDELEGNARDIQIQLDKDRTFGVLHRSDAWSKNRHVLDDSRYSHIRKHVEDAHARASGLDQSTADRYNAASQDEVNDPSWQRLTESEKNERHTTLAATKKAILELDAILDFPPKADPSPPKTREEKLRELGDLIHEGEELRETLPRPSKSYDVTVVKARMYDLPRVWAWDKKTWRWIEANCPEHLGHLTRYKDNPREEPSIRAMPKFMERRLEALRKVLDRL